MEELNHALVALHDPQTSQLKRKQCHEYCEELKNNLNVSIPLAVQMCGYSGPHEVILRHFGLHCLEFAATTRWNSLTDQQQGTIRDRSMQLLSTGMGCGPGSNFAKQKVVAIVAEIAKRTWPQRWPDMTDSLFEMAKSGDSHVLEQVVFVFRNLAEELSAFNPHLPDTRRREVQVGLLAVIEQIFSFLQAELVRHFPQFQNSLQSNDREQALRSKRVIEAILQTYLEFLEIVPNKYLFETNLMDVMCAIANTPDFCQVVNDILAGVVNRKHTTLDPKHHRQVLSVWGQSIRLTEALLSADMDQETKILLLEKCQKVLGNLCKQHCSLVAGPEFQELRVKHLQIHVQLLRSPSLSLGLSCVASWIHITKNARSDMIKPEYKTALLSELFKVLITKVVKSDKDIGEDNDTFDTPAQYLDKFAKFRGSIVELMSEVVPAEPYQCCLLLLQRLEQCLQVGNATQKLNGKGFATVLSPVYLQLEAIVSLLETVMKKISPSLFQSDQAVVTVSQNLLMLFMKFETLDPLLYTLKLRALAVFVPLYQFHNSSLSDALQQLFQGLQFHSSSEPDFSWLQLNEDVKACRRRAIFSLIHISKSCASRLLSLFGALAQQVKSLAESNRISESEKIRCFEFLVIVSNASSDLQQQQAFIVNILSEPVNSWSSSDFKDAFTDTSKFVALMGCNQVEEKDINNYKISLTGLADNHPRRVRVKIQHILATFASTFKTICKVSSVESKDTSNSSTPAQMHPAAASVGHVLPQLYTFLKAVNNLWNPQVLQSIPQGMRPMLSPTQKYLEMYLGATYQETLMFSVWKWLFVVLEDSYMLLAVACGMGEVFYANLNIQDVTDSVLFGVQHLGHRHLKAILEKFVVPYIKNCPSHLYHSHLSPLLQRVIAVLFLRLNDNWNAYNQKKLNTEKGQEQYEILEEEGLRILTRMTLDLFLRALSTSDGAVIGQPVKKQALPDSKLEENKLLTYLFSVEVLCNPMLTLVTACMCWPDSIAVKKASQLLHAFAPFIASNHALHDHLGESLKACLLVLANCLPEAVEQDQSQIVPLVKRLYQLGSQAGSSIPYTVFHSVPPNVPESEAQNLHSLLMVSATEKKYRAAIKNFLLRWVIGKNLQSGREESNKVLDLPEKLVVVSKKAEALKEDNTELAVDWNNLQETLFTLFS